MSHQQRKVSTCQVTKGRLKKKSLNDLLIVLRKIKGHPTPS